MSYVAKSLVKAAATVLALLSLLSVLYAYHLANPRIQIPKDNRDKFANVAVLLDGTPSINDVHWSYGKQLVVQAIVPNQGIGDRLVVYSIGPEFSLHNIVSGATFGEQPPQFDAPYRADVLDVLRAARSTNAPGRVRAKLYDMIRELEPLSDRMDSVRARWSSQISAVRRPMGRGTNLTCALEALDRYFKASVDPTEERRLYVVSDLIHDVRQTRCSVTTGDELLSGVRVVLVYPHDSAHDWTAITDSWRRFFGNRDIEVVPLSAALNRSFLLPPNPLAGLERRKVLTFWQNLKTVYRSIATRSKSEQRAAAKSE